MKPIMKVWEQIYDAAEAAPDAAFEALRFIKRRQLPVRRVTSMLELGYIHGWQMRLLSHVWAGQDVIHDVDQVFKPEIAAWFSFVEEQGAVEP